jgi:O-antigen/teichoic acid export membrane protein
LLPANNEPRASDDIAVENKTLRMSSAILTSYARPGFERYRGLATAMVKSGAGSVLSGIMSAAATKAIALAGGPAAVAQLVTLQQLRQTAVVAATANGQTALVQGASSLEGTARNTYLRTSTVLFAAATLVILAVLNATPGYLFSWSGPSMVDAHVLKWLGAPVALTSAFVFLSGVLNAAGRIGRLAAAQVVASGSFLAAIVVALLGHAPIHARTVIGAMTVSAAASLAVTVWALTEKAPLWKQWLYGEGSWWSSWAVRRFLSLSTVMFISGWLGSFALVLVRAHILSAHGAAITGQFDAAWTISMTHVTLALSSLQAYYLPALARCTTADDRTREIRNAVALVPWVAVAVIAPLAFTKPFVLRVLYSGQFVGAAQYLRWTLIGDYLKVTSWLLSIPMIAAGRMKSFLWLDLSAYATFVAAAYYLPLWQSAAEAAAVAFCAMYLVHLLGSLICGAKTGLFKLGARDFAHAVFGFILILAASIYSWRAV